MIDQKKNDQIESEAEGMETLGLVWDLGWVLVVPVLVGVVVGRWLDSKLNSLPLFTLILIGGGAILGFSAMIWKAKQVTERGANDK